MIATRTQLAGVDVTGVDPEASPAVPQVIITIRHVDGTKPWEVHVAAVDTAAGTMIDKIVRNEHRHVAIAEALHFAGQAQDPPPRGAHS